MQIVFNAQEVEPQSSYDPVPAGTYTAEITESEIKPTKNNNGEYLQLTFKIIDGDHSGRLIWDRLNLVNTNETAVEIARANLSAICHSVGELNLQDTEQLHNKPLRIKVKVRPATDNYDASNEISGYMPVDVKSKAASGAAKEAKGKPW